MNYLLDFGDNQISQPMDPTEHEAKVMSVE